MWFPFERCRNHVGVVPESEVLTKPKTFFAEDAVDDTIALDDPLLARVSGIVMKPDLVSVC